MKREDRENFLQASFRELGMELCAEQVSQFLAYYEMLISWNQRFNLTAITEFEDVVRKHFADSAAAVKVPDFAEALGAATPSEAASGFAEQSVWRERKMDDPDSGVGASFHSRAIRLIDVGTGAGFPGIPLKIAFPELEVVLLDSLQKRVGFLSEVISALGLKGICAVHARAEDFAREADYRERFDFAASRAVANLTVLSELCLPFVKLGGCFLAYKSERAEEETGAAKNAIRLLGGELAGRERFSLPGSGDARELVVIRKTSQTPEKYPRRAGVPEKKPL